MLGGSNEDMAVHIFFHGFTQSHMHGIALQVELLGQITYSINKEMHTGVQFDLLPATAELRDPSSLGLLSYRQHQPTT